MPSTNYLWNDPTTEGSSIYWHMYTIFPKNWFFLLILFVGCVTPELNTNGPLAETVSKASLSQEEITNRLDYWREEAIELHHMARRREHETDVLSKSRKGVSADGLIIRMRTLAQQLHAAAEYADEQARESQRQVLQE